MTITKGFFIIILSGIAFALGGGAIGYGLATFAPGYYRGVFPSGGEAWFDPVVVGLGLGLTQGLICGLFLGGVVVLAVAWYNARRGSLALGFPPGEARQRIGSPERPEGEEGFTSRPYRAG
jgi:hypothetical protein